MSWTIEAEWHEPGDATALVRLTRDGWSFDFRPADPQRWPVAMPLSVETRLCEGLPFVVVFVAATADVVGVEVISDGGRYAEHESEAGPAYDVALSPVDSVTGLRYGLILLPEGEGQWETRATRADGRPWPVPA